MSQEELILMSQKERDRLKVLHEAKQRHITQKQAAAQIGVSERWVGKLLGRLRQQGDRAVLHRGRGRRSNRKIPEPVREKAVGVVRKEYRDFGPTLASEYLAERHGIQVSRETLRGWMIGAQLWKPRRARIERVHTWRPRRAQGGELVQWDTSEHDWLEGRGEKLYLTAMIDDATSRALARFVRHDSTPENLRLLRLYLKRWGRPQAFYTDKASLFRTPRPPEPEEQLEGQRPRTQIGRALQELDIEWIPAHSPQAKGRIERFFGTAQDRLVKGLRKEGIDTLAGAQRYLERVFLPLWNRRFTVAAANPTEAHRPLGPEHNLAAILSQVESRVVAPDYTVQWHGQRYQIAREAVRAGLRGARVRVEKRLDGTVAVRFREHYLPVRKCGTTARQPLGEQPEPPRAVAKARPPASKAPPHRWMEGFDLRRSKPLWAILREEQGGPPQ
ncbi:MAG: ISNCY family transposase [Acidobacteria bacterium]|nr:ISNCY family transposase [Acidobacteriota bacterium]